MQERQKNERQHPGCGRGDSTKRLLAIRLAAVALVLSACTAAPLPSPSPGPASPSAEPVPASTQPVAASPSPDAASMTPGPTPTGTIDPSVPRPRIYHVMVGLDRGVALFGGSWGSGPGKDLFDTWEFRSATGWVSTVAQDTPWGDATAWDGQSRQVIAFLDGGRVSLYDPAADAWTERPAAGGSTPTSTFGMRAAYDDESDRTILLDGAGRTWAYDVDTDTWTQSAAAARPAARLWHMLAYDEGSDRVVLFGGTTRLDALFGDTWAYDLNSDTWKEMSPAAGPSPRRYGAMAYDPGTDRMILFGGLTSQDQPLGDTWAYDLDSDTWTELAPAAAPSPRAWHAMAYDRESGMIFLFGGGRTRDEATAETWRYDARATTWTRSE